MKAPDEELTAAYGAALVELGQHNGKVVVLDADIADSCRTEDFRKAFPERSFDLGVAEQSLPTVGAGLALCGKIPFCNTFGVFAATRGLDMIRQSVCYNRANVKIVAHASGQSMGYTGPSHHTLEDIAALRALPHMTILSPCDGSEVRAMLTAMAELEGPAYLRLTRATVPSLHGSEYSFKLGQAVLIADGRDLTLFATGDLVHMALRAREVLAGEGVGARVVDVPCLKPLPDEEIVKYGGDTGAAITVEDHSIYGGLGSIVSEAYASSLCKPVARIGIPDIFTESDDYQKLRAKAGLSVESICRAARLLLAKIGRRTKMT
jgi:transketolase